MMILSVWYAGNSIEAENIAPGCALRLTRYLFLKGDWVNIVARISGEWCLRSGVCCFLAWGQIAVKTSGLALIA